MHATLATSESSASQSLRRPVMHQRWSDLLFLHWRFDPAVVQAAVPDCLTVETFDHSAWLGVVPFRMSGVRPRGLPAVPGLSAFPELNLRTYVVDEHSVPGVWFFSLDAGDPIAVWVARTFFHLPYHWASMQVKHDADGWIEYRSRRRSAERSAFDGFRYRGLGEAREALKGSLEAFLIERYKLYSVSKNGRVYRGTVSHPPYAYQETEVEQFSEHLFELNRLPKPNRSFDHACYVPGVDVDILGLERVE